MRDVNIPPLATPITFRQTEVRSVNIYAPLGPSQVLCESHDEAGNVDCGKVVGKEFGNSLIGGGGAHPLPQYMSAGIQPSIRLLSKNLL